LPQAALQTLSDPAAEPESRQAAVRALAFRPTVEGDAALLRLAVEEPDVTVRFLAVRALERRRLGGPTLAEVLRTDPDPRVRRAAARALGLLGGDGTRQETALVAALEDANPDVVLEAVAALGQVGSRASLEGLKRVRGSGATPETRTAARDTHRAISRRATQREKTLAETRARRALAAAPWTANPALHRVLRFGGGVYFVGFGVAAGGALGALVPLAGSGKVGTYLWPVGAGAGAVVGGAASLGYAALRRFDFSLTDALLVSAHGTSGMVAGMGLGLWLGARGTPSNTAALALVSGTGSLLASAAANPWMRARPAAVAAVASSSALAGATGFLLAGVTGADLLQRPQDGLGLAMMGQGLGTVLGTAVSAGVPLTGVDVALMDVGAAAGGALATAAAVGVGTLGPYRPSRRLLYASVLGGVLGGAGGGLLLGALLPRALSSRLTGGFALPEVPITLVPAAPVPTVEPTSGKTTGAWVPLLSGTFR
jgi:hypothetical protein